jgi:hypothetical protein
MPPSDRLAYPPIVERPAFKLPDSARMAVWVSSMLNAAHAVHRPDAAGGRLADAGRAQHAVSQQAQSQFSICEAIGRHFMGLPVNSRLL